MQTIEVEEVRAGIKCDYANELMAVPRESWFSSNSTAIHFAGRRFERQKIPGAIWKVFIKR